MLNEKNTIFISAIVAIMTLLFGSGLIIDFYYRPSLSYSVLPSYDIDEMKVTQILIKNNGNSNVNNLKITLKTNSEIKSFNLDTPEVNILENHWINPVTKKEMQLVVSRLLKKSSLAITVSTQNEPGFNVIAAANETVANKEDFDSITLVENLVLLSNLFSLLALTAVIFLKTRKFVSTRYCYAKRKELSSTCIKYLDGLLKLLSIVKVKLNESSVDKVSINNEIRHVEEMIDEYKALIDVDGVCLLVKGEKTE